MSTTETYKYKNVLKYQSALRRTKGRASQYLQTQQYFTTELHRCVHFLLLNPQQVFLLHVATGNCPLVLLTRLSCPILLR
jgi:hypothetical protein